MNGLLPAPDDPLTHIDIWSGTTTTMAFTGNHVLSPGDRFWWTIDSADPSVDDCAGETFPSDGTGAELNYHPSYGLSGAITLPSSGKYVLCLEQLLSAPSLGVVEHSHVTAGVSVSPPAAPPPMDIEA